MGRRRAERRAQIARDDGARGVDEQLKRSRALQNEGLEGFPTRAGGSSKLGFTSFISFGPLIAVFSVVFVASYLLFDPDFIPVHRAAPRRTFPRKFSSPNPPSTVWSPCTRPYPLRTVTRVT